MSINNFSNVIPEGLIVFAVLFSGFTVIAPLIVSYASRWQLIEKLFQTNNKSLKHDFGLYSFQFGKNTIFISVKSQKGIFGFVKVGLVENGIYLKIVFPYSLITRPVNLPWNEIIIQKESATENYEIIIKRLLDVRIILLPELANRLIAFQNQKLPD